MPKPGSVDFLTNLSVSTIGRNGTLRLSVLALALAVITIACSSDSGPTTRGSGGAAANASGGGTGGATATGSGGAGGTGRGGAAGNPTGGATTSTGGSATQGGASGNGGTPGTGGHTGSGGTAGAMSSGGASSVGGTSGLGGASAPGGAAGRGGNGDSGGAAGGGGNGERDATGSDATSADTRNDAGLVRDGTGTGGGGGSAADGRGGAGGASGAGGGTNLPAMTIWIAGDSTVKTYAAGNTDGYNGTELEGWGQEVGQYFSSNVTVNNQAIGGRSVAMFMWTVATDSSGNQLCVDDQGTPKFQLDSSGNKIDTSQWARIKNGIKAGDFLMIQFGHNDETNTCPRHVTTADFETDLGFMADTVAGKGATPIFVTPMGHRTFSGTKFNNTLLPYANAMKDEASKKSIEVEDLNLRSGEYYESVGNSYLATNIFDGGTTHFIKAGAIKMAELIIGEIKKNNGPLAAYLK